jgi:hypothetical protein
MIKRFISVLPALFLPIARKKDIIRVDMELAALCRYIQTVKTLSSKLIYRVFRVADTHTAVFEHFSPSRYNLSDVVAETAEFQL